MVLMLIYFSNYLYTQKFGGHRLLTVNYENMIPNSEKHSYLSNTTTMEFCKRMTLKCRSNTH